MKKLLLLLLTAALVGPALAQDFPYGKMLKMTPEELKEQKFKYNEDLNQWVLRKSNGFQKTANILSALNGAEADIRPDKNDYVVVIQNGEQGTASIDVTFYNDDIYHELLTFANDNGQGLLETNSGKISKCQFDYDNYSFVLQMTAVPISATTGRTRDAFVKTKDESYNVYDFIIITGVEPASPYLDREAAKQQKRDDKGRKKRSAADLM